MDINNMGRFGTFLLLLWDLIKTVIHFIGEQYLRLLSLLVLYKKILLILMALFLISIICRFLWKNRENLSRFLWSPEPLIGGLALDIFGKFYKNHLTEGLLELQKFLHSLPPTAPIIVILGEEDIVNDVVTFYSSSSFSWFFIRNNIYLYIKKNDDVKFVVSFLNKIRPNKPLNSLVVKTNLELGVVGDVVKTIAMISGVKVPLYLVFHNLKWCEYMWEIFPRNSILGFLMDKNDAVSSVTINNDINNLKMYIWEHMLNSNNCNLDLWKDYDSMTEAVTEIVLYTFSLNYNFFRGVFFTCDEYKAHLKNRLSVPQEKITYFTNFYQEVVEQEVLLSTPLKEDDVFVSRYAKYQNNLFIFFTLCISAYFLNMNLNLWNFNKKFSYHLLEYEAILNNKNEKKTSYMMYNFLAKINSVNLKKISYKMYPHNYLVNNLYEKLCEIEEIFIFNILDDKTLAETIVTNDNNQLEEASSTAFRQLWDYTNKILELERNIFYGNDIKRFGIYKKRNDLNNKNAKIFFEKSFHDIRDNYFILLKNFLSLYCNHEVFEEVEALKEYFNKLFKNSDIQSEDIQILVSKYHKLDNLLKIKNSKIQILNLYLLFKNLEKSIIFGPNVVTNSQMIIKNSLGDYYMQITSVKDPLIGNMVLIENDNLVLCEKIKNIVSDMEEFLQEPFMQDINNNDPVIPPGNMVSSWNIPILKDIWNLRNKDTEFKEKLSKYSPELYSIFYNIFQRKLSKLVFTKIGIAQNIISAESINLQNTSDAFGIIVFLLDYFLETGNLEYYDTIINIFLHDLIILDKKIENQMEKTIFYSYRRLHSLKKDNLQEFLCETNKPSKVKEFLDGEIDNLIKIYNGYMAPILKIIDSDHFSKYRGSQSIKYRNVGNEIKKYEKSLDNSIQNFTKFIISLKNYSIYNSFNTVFEEVDDDGYLADLLTNLKNEIISVSQKLYTEELSLSYDNLKQEFKIFSHKFPFDNQYTGTNNVNIHELYKFLQKNKTVINIFQNNNIIGENRKKSIYKLQTLLNGIKKDEEGYYYSEKVIYNHSDIGSRHSKYLGLVNINQTKQYNSYELQEEIKLYIDSPVYIHMELSHLEDLVILPAKHHFFKIIKTNKGITLVFDNFWGFFHYIQLHEEKKLNDDVTIIVSIPVEFGGMVSSIRFPITFKNFIFFPNEL
jgi:hypothetical protein